MTRHGKIARLPLALRQELNQRLQNGEQAATLLPWLNALPETQSLLAAGFDGQPVSEQNLSLWRQGGYREWEAQQLALEAMDGVIEDTAQLQAASAGGAVERLTVLLTARIAVKLRRLALADDKPEHGREWQALFNQVAALRREERSAESLRLRRERLEWQRLQSKAEREKEFWKWTDENPEVRKKFLKIQEAQQEHARSVNEIYSQLMEEAKATLRRK